MKYSMESFKKENMARAIGVALPISTKQSVEVCGFLRHKNLTEAKQILQKVIAEEQHIPYRRYHHSIPHRKTMGPGRYPKKTSWEMLKLLESVEANAQFKGLNTANLIISHISASKAAPQSHGGRHGGRKMKRTHVQVVVEELSKESKDSAQKKKTMAKKSTPLKEDAKK